MTQILPHHIHIIASMLDHPSIYMGGPSRHSIKKAERIWESLIEEGLMNSIWLPIATALKTNRAQILIRGRYSVTGYVSDVYHSWWDAQDAKWARWPHAAFEPTHWMPILDLPNSMCPFDKPTTTLLPTDPCPICGDLGTFDAEESGKCISLKETPLNGREP